MDGATFANGFDGYYPIEEAYSIHRILNNLRVVRDNPNNYTGYQTRATIVDDEGNEYRFQHSHSDSNLNGRPLPRMVEDCPRPNAKISDITGECLDTCRTDFDCPLSYGCQNRGDGIPRCYPQTCTTNHDCETNLCSNGVCQPKLCDSALPSSYNFEANERFPNQHCISTSHYWLQGRPGVAPLDKRYDNQY